MATKKVIHINKGAPRAAATPSQPAATVKPSKPTPKRRSRGSSLAPLYIIVAVVIAIAGGAFPEDRLLTLHLRGAAGEPGLRLRAWPPLAAEGIARFDAGDWWEAHESLEEVMAEAPGDEPLLYKALIQAGSAFHLFSRGREAPGRKQAGRIALINRSRGEILDRLETEIIGLHIEAEPGIWYLQRDGVPGDPMNGGLLLIAHHADLEFGDVVVTALP